MLSRRGAWSTTENESKADAGLCQSPLESPAKTEPHLPSTSIIFCRCENWDCIADKDHNPKQDMQDSSGNIFVQASGVSRARQGGTQWHAGAESRIGCALPILGMFLPVGLRPVVAQAGQLRIPVRPYTHTEKCSSHGGLQIAMLHPEFSVSQTKPAPHSTIPRHLLKIAGGQASPHQHGQHCRSTGRERRVHVVQWKSNI